MEWSLMLTIYQATATDERHVRELFWEHLQWANENINKEFGINFDIATILEEDMLQLSKFYPPEGRLLLARLEENLAGLGCLRQIAEDTAEVKRMYVHPSFRRSGVGRALLDRLLEEAKHADYKRVRLDSARFMHGAHALYQSAGFQEIEAYPESEVLREFQRHWVFMELPLEQNP